MIPLPAGTRVWLASGVTDMRKGWSSLSLLVQEQMKLDPHTGHLFVFRGRQGGLIKVIWYDGRKRCVDLTPFPLAGSIFCISFPIHRDTDHFGRPFRFAA
jgi:transposase